MIIDVDANATYAPCEALQSQIIEGFRSLGNPSSLHRGGQRAKAAIEEVRERIRNLVGATPRDQVVFTSGATEGNNFVVSALATPGASVVSSTIEHPCILSPLKRAQVLGANVSLVNPSASGEISPDSLGEVLNPSVRLVSIMAANNETGVINDITALAKFVRAATPDAMIHSDAAQIIGKIPVDFRALDLDLMTISGHKFGALTGVGALVIREGIDLPAHILGGPQENKLRGGTENVLGVISLGLAANNVSADIVNRHDYMQRVRDAFESALLELLPDAIVNGKGVRRLPNTSSVFISGIIADDLLVALDLDGVLISSGAACSSGKPEPSHVLSAMGQEEPRVRSTFRVSFRADQPTDIGILVAQKISKIVRRMRGLK
jgi:cysteine desulfurase